MPHRALFRHDHTAKCAVLPLNAVTLQPCFAPMARVDQHDTQCPSDSCAVQIANNLRNEALYR